MVKTLLEIVKISLKIAPKSLEIAQIGPYRTMSYALASKYRDHLPIYCQSLEGFVAISPISILREFKNNPTDIPYSDRMPVPAR